MRRFNLILMVLLTVLFCNSSPAWSLDRFVDMGDGTVLDTWQSIRWLKNANCVGEQNWSTAMTFSNNLVSGMCGLSDGSVAGTWRLPDVLIQSRLLDPQYTTKDSLSSAFTNFQVLDGAYWTYTTYDDGNVLNPRPSCLNGACAYWVKDDTGGVAPAIKSLSNRFWPVRDGHIGWITISPSIAGKDFGSVPPNTISASQTFTISNNGTMAVFINILLSGGDTGMFALNKGDGTGGTCGAATTLGSGASCTVSASFKPTKLGGKSTYLWINTTAVNPNTYILLSGGNTLDPNVSWWKAENNAGDSSGENNGTPNGGVAYAPGKVGQAFSFDGSAAQYVSVPSSSTLDIYGTHSIAFWIKPATLPAGGNEYRIVSKWTNGYEHKQVSIDSDGKVHYFLYGTTAASGVTSTNAVQGEVWTHVVATYDGANMKIYLNGMLDASIAAAGDVGDGSGTLYLGYNPDTAFAGGEAPFNGLLDEVGWFNRALSPVEVGEIANMPPDAFTFTARTGMPLNMVTVSNPITVTGINYVTAISITNGEYAVSTDGGYSWSSWTNAAGYVAVNNQVKVRQTSSSSNSTLTTATLTIGGITGAFNVTTAASGVPDANGLVAWWKGDNNAYDTMGGNNGTLNGGTYAPGKLGQAFSFDGTEQYVSIPASSAMDIIYGTHTVAFWVKFAANPAAGKSFYLVNKWTDRYEDKRVSIDEYGKVSYFLFGASGSGVTSTNALTPGVWTNVVVTYDGANMKIYINGVLDASAAAPGNVANSTGGLYFGYNPDRTSQGNEAPFSGQLDEVLWYNRTLSAAEIATLLPNYTLSVSVSGTGSGTVTSAPQGTNPVGVSCMKTGGTCATTYSFNTPVTLTPVTDAISTFDSWGGDCSGSGACAFTMDTDKSVTATLTQAPLARNTTFNKNYPTLAAALTDADRAAFSGDELLLLGTTYDGAVSLNKGFVLNGGWNATYQGLSGLPTTLNGDLTIQNGGSTAGSVDVKGKLVIQGGSLQVNGVTVRQ